MKGKQMSEDYEKLYRHIQSLVKNEIRIQTQLSIAIEGLKALSSGGEQTGIANKTLEAIQELDLPQESLEVEE